MQDDAKEIWIDHLFEASISACGGQWKNTEAYKKKRGNVEGARVEGERRRGKKSKLVGSEEKKSNGN